MDAIRHAALGLIVLLFPLMASGHEASAQDERSHRTLAIGMTQFPSTFHPSIDSMMAKSYVLAMTLRPFTVFDPQWKLICMLCTELPTLENGGAVRETTPEGKEGIAVTYTIHGRAIWGDGTPVTTKDVTFTWKVGRHPLSGLASAELYKRILSVEVADAKTFTLHFDRLAFDYNAINDFNLLPAHLDTDAFAEPASYRHRTLYDTDTTNPGLYFGPYRITGVEPGSHVVLEPNKSWWGRKPFFTRIVVYVIGNTAALEANLLAGAIDMIPGELGLTLDQALAFAERHGDAFHTIFQPGLVYEHIDLNLDNPILADRRVRRALLHGIDRKAISDQLFAAKQPVATGPVSPLDTVYDGHVPDYPYDPGKAAALLDEAGWKRVNGGVRRNAEGKRLHLTLMTTAGNHTREMIEQVLQSQWRRLGIEARIHNQPARVFFGRTVTMRKFPSLAMFAWISAPDSVPRSTLHSSQIPTQENNFAGQNYMGFSDPDMDTLIDEIEVELDADKRRDMWRRIQQIYAEELPALPLYYRSQPFILPPWLTGLVPTGHQYPSTLWIENWGVENRGSENGESTP